MLTQNSPKLAKKFHCEKCDYVCSKESDYAKHLATRKHNKTYIDLQNSPENSPEKMYTYVKCDKNMFFAKVFIRIKKHVK
jgi:hypothetical protein